MTLEQAIFLLILAEASLAGGSAVRKLALRSLDVFACGFWWAFAGFSVALPFFALSSESSQIRSPSGGYVWLLLLSALSFWAGAVLFLSALKYGNLSLIFPIVRSSPLLALPMAAIFLHEEVTAPHILGTLLILAGLVIFSRTRRGTQSQVRSRRNRAVLLALGCALSDALVLITSKAAVRGVGVSALALAQSGASLLGFFLYSVRFHQLKGTDSRGVALAGIAGLLSWGPGIVLGLFALRRVPAVVAALLSGTGLLFTVLLGVIFFKEKLEAEQVVGAILILVGVTIASVYGF